MLGVLRSFLVNVFTRLHIGGVPSIFHHVSNLHLFRFFRSLYQQHIGSPATTTTAMATSPHDSIASDVVDTDVMPSKSKRERSMVHLKTKEECRLSNETIEVWTVELPSKHAERILKSVDQTSSRS